MAAAVYHDDCPGVSNVAVVLTNWLIAFGSFSLLWTAMNIVRRCLCHKKKRMMLTTMRMNVVTIAVVLLRA